MLICFLNSVILLLLQTVGNLETEVFLVKSQIVSVQALTKEEGQSV